MIHFVLLQDRNDIPPIFTMIPHPVTLEDDVTVGSVVTTLTATDSDGSAPGNKVSLNLFENILS